MTANCLGGFCRAKPIVSMTEIIHKGVTLYSKNSKQGERTLPQTRPQEGLEVKRQQPQNYDFALGLGSSRISRGCQEKSIPNLAAAESHGAAYGGLWRKIERPRQRQSDSRASSGLGTDCRWQATQPDCETSYSLDCTTQVTGTAVRGRLLTRSGRAGMTGLGQTADGTKSSAVLVATANASVGG